MLRLLLSKLCAVNMRLQC
uniref:Uncharacterized protein n=1 Tax=Anguilla anguilla TaxID=7936 RepID=A0A0E9TUP8_ANGAN